MPRRTTPAKTEQSAPGPRPLPPGARMKREAYRTLGPPTDEQIDTYRGREPRSWRAWCVSFWGRYLNAIANGIPPERSFTVDPTSDRMLAAGLIPTGCRVRVDFKDRLRGLLRECGAPWDRWEEVRAWLEANVKQDVVRDRLFEQVPSNDGLVEAVAKHIAETPPPAGLQARRRQGQRGDDDSAEWLHGLMNCREVARHSNNSISTALSQCGIFASRERIRQARPA